MLITVTLIATPAHSSRVLLTITKMSAKLTDTNTPSKKVGRASAKDAGALSLISVLILRPVSESPKSPAKRGAERRKKIVSVNFPVPSAALLKISGTS